MKRILCLFLAVLLFLGFIPVGRAEAASNMISNPFEDVIEGKFYYEPVLWAFYNGITTGKDETHFNPSGECTRAQVVTFLWRAAGEPVCDTSENPFPDVPDGKYYTNAVLWAVENGITSGYKDGTFGPDKTCTRAQIVTFLWRYAGEPGPASMDNPFPDVVVDAYYGMAVLWAVENKITGGFKDGTFGPDKTCTRDQIVTFLYRYMIENENSEVDNSTEDMEKPEEELIPSTPGIDGPENSMPEEDNTSDDSGTMVWIPTKGGKKYHSSESCSNMEDPVQVTLEEAESLGFTPCKRCH